MGDEYIFASVYGESVKYKLHSFGALFICGGLEGFVQKHQRVGAKLIYHGGYILYLAFKAACRIVVFELLFSRREVGEDGAATFFSTVSHDLKRHVKIFVDYQLKDQVPLRIRGNAEYFLTIKKRSKKYPILLIIYYLPFLGLYVR